MALRVKKPDPFTLLLEEISQVHKEITELETANSEVFEAHADLIDQEKALESRLKDLARERSILGRNLTLVDNPMLTVSVNGRVKSIEYDVNRVRELWPADAVKSVLVETVDRKLVDELLKNGRLTDSVAGLAALPRKAETPAVTIKWRTK
jgi:hypothetical protein